MLLGVVGATFALAIMRLALPAIYERISSPTNQPVLAAIEPRPVNKRVYRAITLPTGTRVPKLVRSEYNKMPLVDVNDRGDFIFLTRPPDSEPLEYLHVYRGKSVSSGPVPSDTRWRLTPSGKIIKWHIGGGMFPMFSYGRVTGSSNGYLPFNELRFRTRIDDDGTVLNIQYVTARRQHFYALRRDYVLGLGEVGKVAKEIKRYSQPVDLLEVDEDGAMWMRQYADQKNSQKSSLVKIVHDKSQTIAMPNGYGAVERVCVTGKNLVCSFGNFVSSEPIRSFSRVSGQWKELPIPAGFEFSYVQKVLYDGRIVGFITDANEENMKQVLWDGESVAILNDLPAWPKNGEYSFITNITRRGDMVIRNVLNTGSGTNESYLIHIAEK